MQLILGIIIVILGFVSLKLGLKFDGPEYYNRIVNVRWIGIALMLFALGIALIVSKKI